MNFDLIKNNRQAIRFLIVFVGLYLVLNTVYGFFARSFLPTSDPITQFVAKQVVWILSFFDYSVTDYPSLFSEYIAISNDRQNMIYVYEGCNGLNVMIVYWSFLMAFKGNYRSLAKFSLAGFIGIHVLNLARIVLLYAVAFYFPDYLYFFHKYLFTGIIYVVVFVLWFYWVRNTKK